MIAICLGIAAALAWGLHDFFVRTVSQNSGIFASIITVFGTGVVILGACVVAFGNPVIMTPLSYQLSIASRISSAGVAVYMAFAIGPVSLVAPIFGAYPILSVGWAAVSGTPVSGLQWLAVLTVVAGVAHRCVVVRHQSRRESHQSDLLGRDRRNRVRSNLRIQSSGCCRWR
jgi:drug/metabolite transporter (DMT)-like permease